MEHYKVEGPQARGFQSGYWEPGKAAPMREAGPRENSPGANRGNVSLIVVPAPGVLSRLSRPAKRVVTMLCTM